MTAVSQRFQPSGKLTAPPAPTTGCYHCGEEIRDLHFQIEDKHFCCEGCKTVYEILNTNGLCQYYDIDQFAGVSLKGQSKAEYAWLDDADVQARLINFTDGNRTRVTFYIPQMHCASCIWLLENLYRLSPGILESSVHFTKKEIYITFDGQTTLRQIVQTLASIGYAPAINLGDLDQQKKRVADRSFYYKLGVAGFAFGNIMLLSFPEYLGLDKATDAFFFQLFGYLNIALALPVVLYSAQDYLRSAWLVVRQGTLNIDVPLALGIVALFGRSVFEILTHTGAGFLDSLAGLVFFLLVGKWFQQKTYHHIAFDRDYKSYFPIAALKKNETGAHTIPLDKLEPGDVIIIKHKELIPADGVLLKGDAEIDYSFVTGEAVPVPIKSGEKIYAGGRQMGGTLEVSLTRQVSQSYLTQLWNSETFAKPQHFSGASKVANRVGKYFTVTILFIATAALAWWLPSDSAKAINAFTAVLIIACPCAVALAIPFIFGNVLRILGKNELYLKNTGVIESLAETQTTVFDKTGTLTNRQHNEITFVGEPLSALEKAMLHALTEPSTHPMSQHISAWATPDPAALEWMSVSNWQEVVGKGVQGIVCQKMIKIGSRNFVDAFLRAQCTDDQGVYVQINNELRGYFHIQHHYRAGLQQVVDWFRQRGRVFLLSGDNNREQPLLSKVFGGAAQLHFRQDPHDKLHFIKQLQGEGRKVLMLGDGLNDAGALQQSDAGIVITEDTNNFTPACDAILHANQFARLPALLTYAQRSVRLVYYAYAMAFCYNVVGLSYAVSGTLSPVVAAILMPLSSVTVVLFGVIASNVLARRFGL